MPGLDQPQDFAQWMRFIEKRLRGLDWRIAGVGAAAAAGGGGGTPGIISPIHMRRTHVGAFTVGNNSFIQMPFNTVLDDIGGIVYDGTTTARDFTVPVEGDYFLAAGWGWASNTTGRRSVAIQVNGADVTGVQDIPLLAGTSAHTSNIAVTIHLDAGDKVRFMGFQNSGGNLNVVDDPTRQYAMVTLVNGATGPEGPPGPAGSPLEVVDEVASIVADTHKMTFVGAGVVATLGAANEAIVTIPGGVASIPAAWRRIGTVNSLTNVTAATTVRNALGSGSAVVIPPASQVAGRRFRVTGSCQPFNDTAAATSVLSLRAATSANNGGTVIGGGQIDHRAANRRQVFTVVAEFVWPGPAFTGDPYNVVMTTDPGSGNGGVTNNIDGGGWLFVDEFA